MLFESGVAVYSNSESSNLARDVKGLQSLLDFGGGGVGGVAGGRNTPPGVHGIPSGESESAELDEELGLLLSVGW